MPIRPYRITIPILIEDVDHPNALAVHDKLEIIIEQENPYLAARALEHHWNNLPMEYTIGQRLQRYPDGMGLRVEWPDPHLVPEGATRINHHMDGRYDGIDRERGLLRFTTWADYDVGGVISCGDGPTFEIPFENIRSVSDDPWEHDHYAGVDDVQRRIRVQVSGYFTAIRYDSGGIVLNALDRYIPRLHDGGIEYLDRSEPFLGVDR